MLNTYKTIAIEPLAPAKPDVGAPCNGCGICCLVAPCPVGMVLSRRRQGTCVALSWDAAGTLYRCGAMTQPGLVLQQVLPATLRRLAGLLAPSLARLARRAIAAGSGCDCDLQVLHRPEAAADVAVVD